MDLARIGLGPDLADAAARRTAVDPSQNIVLEASAGTGKTRVLVERYVNLLRAGVEPDHILAITFTRKAAAEMRQRIVERLKEASRLVAVRRRALARSAGAARRHRDFHHRRVLPVAAAGVPARGRRRSGFRPGGRHGGAAPYRGVARPGAADLPRRGAEDDDVALVFAQLGERRLRTGIAALLDRRLVAPQVLRRFLQSGPRNLTAAVACEAAASGSATSSPASAMASMGF